MKLFLASVAVCLAACVSNGQSTAQNAADEIKVANYAAALQACVLGAKAQDAGMPGYEACADAVDKQYGTGKYADGGAE